MRTIFVFRTTITDLERGLLFEDGRFQRVLTPGRYSFFDPMRRYSVEQYSVVRGAMPLERAVVLEREHPAIAAEHLTFVRTASHEVAIVSFDGEAKVFVPPNTTKVYWKTLTDVSVDVIDTRAEMWVRPEDLVRLDLASSVSLVHHVVVQAHETGLLFVDGELSERLEPGRHAFWKVGRDVTVRVLDMRSRPVEVTAQEILTKDRVGVRVTLTAFYRIIDAERSVQAVDNLETALYRLIQFAIREAVAARTLDDILAARDALDAQVRDYVAARAAELGAQIGDIGVKDIILPGDVRDLLNMVVEAERTAKANLIRRQEETAATRSLLNTAKLMDDNPLLLRLKELEAIERLVEKVGRIDLHAGQGGAGALGDLLSQLYRLESSGDRKGPSSD